MILIKNITLKFLITIILFVLLTSCEQNNKPNVVIITFDTTRADHIGVYGKNNALTPVIDKLATEGILYKNALSPIPITLPSHSTIMTGKVPFVHGVRDNGIFSLSPENNTLAEILKQNGYNTAAAIGAFPLVSEFGIDQGFDFFNEHISRKSTKTQTQAEISNEHILFEERTSTQVNEAIMPWITDNHKSPFFTWIHYYDPHFPHKPPTPYNYSFINDLYQGEIAYSDESFGEIIELLKDLDVYDNTLIVFTSDHGEGNGDHGELTHVSLIYNSTLHVPLIIKYPNNEFANTVIENWVGIVDIFPTILNYLSIDHKENIQGIDLPKDNTETNKSEYYAETLSSRLSRGWGEQRGLIKNEFKYIYGPNKELYNLANDPNELHNLIKSMPEYASQMKNDLQDYIDEHQVGSTNNVVQTNKETLKTLRGLGYVQSTDSGNISIEEKLNDEGDPPQDHVKELKLYYEAKNLILNGQHIEANRQLKSLLENDPHNFLVLELKIYSDIVLGNYSSLKNTILNLPENSSGIMSDSEQNYYLAKISVLEGNEAKAISILSKSQSIEKTLNGQLLMAEIYKKQNNIQKYQSHLLNILDIDSDLADVIIELAITYFKQGNHEKARMMFTDAINKNPFYEKSFYNFGVFLKEINDYENSIKQFKRAIKLDKKHLNARLALIQSFKLSGNLAQAKENLLELEKIAPKSIHYQNAKQELREYEN